LTQDAAAPAKDTNAMMIKTSLTAISLCAALVSANPAAAEPLALLTDQTKALTVAKTPATIVVGNPSIADVTIQDNNIFLHGRAFGTTNIILLDEAGATMSEFEVTVTNGISTHVAVYRGGYFRYSMVCAPVCEGELQQGDEKEYFSTLLSQANGKLGLATGKTASDVQQTGGNNNSGDAGDGGSQ
jgi:hypothetical protein